MRCLYLSCKCKCHYIFWSDWETLYIFSASNLRDFIFTCEGHDEAFGNHPLECTLRSCENQISRSDSGARLINLSFRKFSNERRCTNHFTFNLKLPFHVTFVLPGRNSRTNKSHPKETSRTCY